MPPRMRKPCAAAGCGALTTTRHCDKHKSLGWETHHAGRSKEQRGYGKDWQRLRLLILNRDKYLCQCCRREGIATHATDVDHVIAKAHGGTDIESNLEALCKPCHRSKTAHERLKSPG
ncbi:HNH endonuclease [Shewanella surugensis]|uniref:Putative HNH nuclease YajD n=1 Tax=Shewanella surugensis TaxID=212020 RepID=A0ABT0LG95_9GAMM|nr:HNH endonuclease signature motif containing protein [Shewanella surugensis]MCL1126721.1 HNH endonuclease [Shewanella surugensis]